MNITSLNHSLFNSLIFYFCFVFVNLLPVVAVVVWIFISYNLLLFLRHHHLWIISDWYKSSKKLYLKKLINDLINEKTKNDIKEELNCYGFLCLNGKCIDSASYCNGVYDCADRSDEINCPRRRRGTII